MDFNILECKRFIVPCATVSEKRLVHNYEFDFYLKGPRTINIDGRISEISDNCICFRRPGQIVCSSGDYDSYLLTVDFSKQTPVENYLRNTAQIVEPVCENLLLDSLPDAFAVSHGSEIRSLFSRLINLPDINARAGHLLVKEILLLLNADLFHGKLEEEKDYGSPADAAAVYIRKNFRENITLPILSSHVHLDKSYLVRLFKKKYSVTPIEYLIQCRLQHAVCMLSNTDATVNEIASECGYTTASFFIRQFKKYHNETPTSYRANLKNF